MIQPWPKLSSNKIIYLNHRYRTRAFLFLFISRANYNWLKFRATEMQPCTTKNNQHSNACTNWMEPLPIPSPTINHHNIPSIVAVNSDNLSTITGKACHLEKTVLSTPTIYALRSSSFNSRTTINTSDDLLLLSSCYCLYRQWQYHCQSMPWH